MTDTSVFDEGTQSIAGDVTEMLEALAERAKDGATLGEVEGIGITKSKERSMVTYGGVELPPRTRVYDRHGNPSDVPTAQLFYHLNKPAADGSGRAFFKDPPKGQRVPIDETCQWCEKRAGRRVKVFYDIDDYEAHCELFHPREWASKQRREDRASSVASVGDIIKILAGLSDEQKAALIGGA